MMEVTRNWRLVTAGLRCVTLDRYAVDGLPCAHGVGPDPRLHPAPCTQSAVERPECRERRGSGRGSPLADTLADSDQCHVSRVSESIEVIAKNAPDGDAFSIQILARSSVRRPSAGVSRLAHQAPYSIPVTARAAAVQDTWPDLPQFQSRDTSTGHFTGHLVLQRLHNHSDSDLCPHARPYCLYLYTTASQQGARRAATGEQRRLSVHTTYCVLGKLSAA